MFFVCMCAYMPPITHYIVERSEVALRNLDKSFPGLMDVDEENLSLSKLRDIKVLQKQKSIELEVEFMKQMKHKKEVAKERNVVVRRRHSRTVRLGLKGGGCRVCEHVTQRSA